MTELERIHVFLDSNDRAIATRIEPFRWGRALLHDRLPLVFDANFLYLEHGEPTAAELAAEAERIQGAAAQLHRRVIVSGPAVERLEPGFAELGWADGYLVVMAHHRPPDREHDLGGVEEFSHEDIRPVWEAGMRAETFTSDPEAVIPQLLQHKRVIAEAVPTRYFGSRADGEIVSYCELYSRDGIGQIESVMTDPAYRGRGLASAVVLGALAASRVADADLTFLVAERDDWPRLLYARLGFDEIGGFGRFTRMAGP